MELCALLKLALHTPAWTTPSMKIMHNALKDLHTSLKLALYALGHDGSLGSGKHMRCVLQQT